MRWNQQRRIIPERDFLSAGMKSAEKNHPCERIFVGRDEISKEESSPEENSYPQGWNRRERIILGRGFLFAGMKSARKNHPWERIFIRRDEISEEESSLEENSYPQRWNQRGRIIPGREFLLAEMQSAEKNHPWERFFIRRDAISKEESSRREIFYPQGWNKRERIIPGREFLLAGMQSARKNHPWERILIGRDEISGEESSLGEVVSLFWTQRG